MVRPRRPKKSKGKKRSSGGHTTSGSNEEEKAQTKKEEIAKGKKPVEVEVEMEDVIMSDVERITQKTKGIVIREAQEPQTHTADKKSKAAVVMSSYELRSGKKGGGVNTASEDKPTTNSEQKGRGKKRGRGLRRTVSLSELNEMEFAQDVDLRLMKRQKKGKGKKVEETDVLLQGLETDPEEACRRIKKGRRNPGNDSDEDGAGGGAGAGAGAGTGAADMAITA